MNVILIAAIVLGAIGLIAALVLYVCSKKFAVYEDPRTGMVNELLPGANCGGCGFPGCGGMADALVKGADAGSIEGLFCPVGGTDTMSKVADLLGMAIANGEPKVAVVRCNGTCEHRPKIAEYAGLRTCAAMHACGAGETACGYGCLGCGDCEEVCQFDAIACRVAGGHQGTQSAVGHAAIGFLPLRNLLGINTRLDASVADIGEVEKLLVLYIRHVACQGQVPAFATLSVKNHFLVFGHAVFGEQCIQPYGETVQLFPQDTVAPVLLFALGHAVVGVFHHKVHAQRINGHGTHQQLPV